MKYLIFGKGDLAREIVSFMNLKNNNYKMLDKNDLLSLNYNEIGKNVNILLAFSDPKLKEKYHVKLKSYNLRISSFVHESVIIGSNVKIGEGVIIFPNCVISNDTIINDLVFINICSNIGHHNVIGSYSSIMSNSNTGGNCKIGEHNYLGTSTTIIPKIKTSNDFFLGAGSLLIHNVSKSSSRYFGNPAKKIKY